MSELISVTVVHEPDETVEDLSALAGRWLPGNPVELSNPIIITRGSIQTIPVQAVIQDRPSGS